MLAIVELNRFVECRSYYRAIVVSSVPEAKGKECSHLHKRNASSFVRNEAKGQWNIAINSSIDVGISSTCP